MDIKGIVNDEEYGFKKFSNIFNKENLEHFYRNEYYETKNKKNNKNQVNRIEVVETTDDDIWSRKTWLLEAKIILERHIGFNLKSLLDIGCGYGTFIDFMDKHGWEVQGLEPSNVAYNLAKQKGLNVFNGTLEDFCNINYKKYSCINLNNVLEHLENPVNVLRVCKNMLNDDGIIRIKVPNDFNQLQFIANKKVKNKNWWIAYPDHINYFTFSSLGKILKDLDFKIIHKSTDFPMEIFLLMGENYVDNPELGKVCHNKRKNFELSLTIEERERLYTTLANHEIGRNIILYGKINNN